jgi:hypothetical protein
LESFFESCQEKSIRISWPAPFTITKEKTSPKQSLGGESHETASLDVYGGAADVRAASP